MPLGSNLAMTRHTMDVDKFHGNLVYMGLAQAHPSITGDVRYMYALSKSKWCLRTEKVQQTFTKPHQ